jgi:alpha,alpha-trehalose phosphorylase
MRFVFTNLMARENLWYAAEVARHMKDNRPDRFEALVHRTELEAREIDDWKEAADRMFLPYDKEAGIHLQDDQFPYRKPWDFGQTPPDRYPLLLHYHPLVIYRHRVIKQADVVLAMFLLGNEFSLEQKKRNFEYYDPLTTGDSSLSVCIQSIVAREIGRRDKAEEYLRYAALMDYADIGGNVRAGCHIASMGGTWMAIVYGIAGFRDDDGRFRFRPRLPANIRRLHFCLTLRGNALEIELRPKEVTYKVTEGNGLVIEHEDRQVRVDPDAPVTLPVTGG